MKQMIDGFPRRNRIDKMTPIELEIFQLVEKIERMGAHSRLTDAVNALQSARDAIADYVEQTTDAPDKTPPPPPVDRTAQTLVDGSPVTPEHRQLRPNGQQYDYVVLSAEERAKGFVRPVRRSYRHVGRPITDGSEIRNNNACGSVTRMNRSIAETYARDPQFYSGTFCCTCAVHLPLDEFIWEGTDERLGS